MNKDENLKQIQVFMQKAITCRDKGEWVLACQYLLDANNLLPKELRAKLPPPPRLEDYD